MRMILSNAAGLALSQGRSTTWLAAAAVALGIGFAAAPAQAGNEFANAFEHELGRIVAHHVGAIGHVAVVAPVIHAVRHGYVEPVHYRPHHDRHRAHARPQRAPHRHPRGRHYASCGHGEHSSHRGRGHHGSYKVDRPHGRGHGH